MAQGHRPYFSAVVGPGPPASASREERQRALGTFAMTALLIVVSCTAALDATLVEPQTVQTVTGDPGHLPFQTVQTAHSGVLHRASARIELP